MNSDQNIRDMGLQPLNQIMKDNKWSNHDFVASAPAGFITHKRCKKRVRDWLTANMQRKIEQAVNECAARILIL